jgi:ubiquinone/menaquinone biosynthesis C-methylase UbiE
MDSEKEFQNKSYEQHADHYRQYGTGGLEEGQAKTWLEADTVDAWRHNRMYKTLDPILETELHASWLTVGDGRYGNDAKYIVDNCGDAMASDISDILLKEAAECGRIRKYSQENAEHLSFEDAAFDYVLCKEAYHHFPRPMIALYEMLRVAKRGIFLIEPNDSHINDRVFNLIFSRMKLALKKILGRGTAYHDFESSGNYVFRLSKREVEKVAMGLNYRTVAFKGINDAYFPGVEFEKLSKTSQTKTKVQALIGVNNLLCRIGISNYGLLAAIIFKRRPSEKLRRKLISSGFDMVDLPENPYITD